PSSAWERTALISSFPSSAWERDIETVALSVGIGRRIHRAQRKPIKRNRDAQAGQSVGGGQMTLLLGVLVIAAGIFAVTRRLDVRLVLLLMGLALGALGG